MPPSLVSGVDSAAVLDLKLRDPGGDGHSSSERWFSWFSAALLAPLALSTVYIVTALLAGAVAVRWLVTPALQFLGTLGCVPMPQTPLVQSALPHSVLGVRS